MATLTEKDKQALLILFKDFENFYNANSLSKSLMISRIGSMKILKKLLNQDLLKDRKIGKSITYKIRLDDDYARKLIAFLLADEANKFKRWKEEFKDLFKKDRIVMLYGSVIKNYSKANDIDIMLIIKKADYKEVAKVIEKRQYFLPKQIHPIELTANDFLQNIRQKKKAIIDIAKNAVILYGQDKYVELMKNVTGV